MSVDDMTSQAFLTGGGEAGALIASFDWSTTSLGPIPAWPQSLRTATALLLRSPVPMVMLWGEDGVMLYNDAYSHFAGGRHPRLLGSKVRDGWPEVAEFNDNVMKVGLAGGTLAYRDQELTLNRSGRPEQVFMNLDYSPVLDESGKPAGVLAVVVETTARVAAERRLRESEARQRFLLDLGDSIRRLGDPLEIVGAATRALGESLGASRVVYADIDEASDSASVTEGWTDGSVPPFPARVKLSDFGERLLEPLRRGETLRVNDVREHGATHRSLAALSAIGVGALVSVPLVKDGRFIADINVHQGRPRKWTEAEVDLIEAVAERTWEAVGRARAETATRESEARLRLMADAVPQIVWITDADGRLEFFNKQWSDYIGAPDVPETVTDLAGSYVHPDDGSATVAAFEEARRSGAVFEIEHRIRRGDGAYRWFLVRAEPHSDPVTGEIVRWFGASTDIHDRKLAEAALQESETRFRGMADHTPVMIWVTDPTGHCIYLNARWYEFTGQAPGSGEGYGWLDAVHPEDRPAAEQAFVSANAESRNYRVDFRVRRADGAYRWVIDAAAARFSADGEYLGYVGSVIDIDERREMEDALRQANERLEERVAEALAERRLLAEIVEGTDAFVQVADSNFRWLAVNKAAADEFERIFGVRPKVGESMLEMLADKPDHQAAVRAAWERALAGEEFTEIGEFGDPGFDRRTYEMKYNVLRGADGERIAAYQFVYDVTERVREQARLAEAEAARHEADALYRAYFENTPEALFVVGVGADGGFVVEQVNPAHEAGVGLRLEDIRGKRVDEILPAEAARRVIETYRHVIETRSVYQYREVFDLDGEPKHWDTSLVPMIDEEGRVVRLIGSSRDVTGQVVAEEALRQSQKMEAMGQLTGGVAHDFNNLLSPIIGGLDLLQRRQVGDERTRRTISGALQSAERAKTLVQRLLAFARRQPLQATAIDVRALVEGMADLVDSTTGPQVRILVEVEDGLPPALADSNQLEMALLNLAVNARDAMPDGGTLTIGAAAEEVRPGHRADLPSGRYIRLSVSDTGRGMDEATLARAIEPFFSTKGLGRGTGLGLSMVHGLAAQLGGGLRIASRLGLGTNVELWLPVALETAGLPEPVPETGVVTAGVALIVDDEELVRASTADLLTDMGYTVRETASAEEALRLISEGLRPDLLVTDHLMPGMSGTELAREVRARLPGTRLLIVSGYADVEGIAPDLPRLTKPFRRSDLVAAVAELSS